jgi:hypothetical protein
MEDISADQTAATQATTADAPAAAPTAAPQAQAAELPDADYVPVPVPPRRFNPLAAYGLITPPHKGAVHYQDGGYFAPDGALLWEDRPPTPPTTRIDEITTVDSATGEMKTELVETVVDALEPGDPKEILSLWLKGEVKLQFGTVRGQLKKGYGKVLATKDDIVGFLVNEVHLVPAELVRVS